MKLSDLKKESAGIIKKVEDSEIAVKLLEFGIIPGATITVISKAPFNGPIYVQVDDNLIALRRTEADFILLE
ncbi:ferrous iron transport protein A [Paracrocinitomix mangrovi]|uniref:FeoA family protein n=1 Tax=Paracrocinitomix mangrovi TaxID=2862509 RepID=UPI001C8D39AA|nr:FeoA family protein [Paracrocinitomix mangrovi]UKN03139.1 ferrous iron transport protein A [Paracrocinitomix mangrovi]